MLFLKTGSLFPKAFVAFNITNFRSYDRIHTDEAVKERGEVFTPTELVNEMLDKLPTELFTDATKSFLDNSCGNGQFLAAVLERKMANGISHEDALKTIYGVELDKNNAKECRERLLRGHEEFREIVEHNIICADALDPAHKGWNKVGFYWPTTEELNCRSIQRYNMDKSQNIDAPADSFFEA